MFNTEIPEIIKAYEDRNKIAVPAIGEIAGIRKRRKEAGNLAIDEHVENTLIKALNIEDEKLPNIEQTQLNESIADKVLTEIQ